MLRKKAIPKPKAQPPHPRKSPAPPLDLLSAAVFLGADLPAVFDVIAGLGWFLGLIDDDFFLRLEGADIGLSRSGGVPLLCVGTALCTINGLAFTLGTFQRPLVEIQRKIFEMVCQAIRVGTGHGCCSSVVERVLGKDEVMGSTPISSFLADGAHIRIVKTGRGTGRIERIVPQFNGIRDDDTLVARKDALTVRWCGQELFASLNLDP
jgi:hypothetical protein